MLKGTSTEQNLLKAFAGESQARNRYTYFSSAAKKEGYEQISAIFTETAENEKEHAKMFFKFLTTGEAVEIIAKFPAGVIGKTVDNLLAAANGENEEWTELYPHFAKVARAEGFEEVAIVFDEIAKVEAIHEQRYRKLQANIINDLVFHKTEAVNWKCRNCGYVMHGTDAPELCPACKHPQAHYEVQETNY
ncbi:MAG: rubrerythrin family protein [Negativicutes bacterium]